MPEIISVLIPDGENEHTLWTSRCLAQAGSIELHILSNERWSPVRFSRYSHYHFRAMEQDNQTRLLVTLELIKNLKIDVLLPISEEGIEFVIKNLQTFSEIVTVPPLPGLNAHRTAKNKWLLHQLAKKCTLPVPQTLLVTLEPDFYENLSSLEYPVLLKPTSRNDGQGIQQFDNPAEVERFLSEQNSEELKNDYIMQNYIPGEDVGLSVLCHGGEILAFTIQQSLISAAHRFGPQMAMQFIDQDMVLATGKHLVSALNWSGVAHIDLRHDSRNNEFKILEVNARFWGSLLGSLVAGVNFPYLTCLLALGRPLPSFEYRHSKYLHLTTALKETAHKFLGKKSLDFTFKETGLHFAMTDPLPELAKRSLIKKLSSLR